MSAVLMVTCQTYRGMWIYFILFNLWGPFCTGSSSPPSPTRLTFSSVNLRNVLHWYPGDGTPDGTHFTVEYAIYGDSIEGTKGRRVNWRAVRQCKEIVRMWCDVTLETENEEQGYYARVRAVSRKASSKWAVTPRRFDPKTDTSLGPPQVHVEIENNSAIITLKGPMRYNPKPNNSILSMAAIYPQMTYKLSIYNTHRNRIDNILVDTSLYKYHLMDYNTEYCFSAQSRFLSMPIQCHSSAWHCVTTPQDPVIQKLTHVIVGIVVPVFCIAVIAAFGYFLYQYLMGKGQKIPHILNVLPFHPAPVTFYPGKLDLMPMSVINKVSPVDPEPLYPFRELQAAQEQQDNLSDSYGFVAKDDQIHTELTDEGREKSPKEGDNGKCKLSIVNVADSKQLQGEVGHCVGCPALQESSFLSQDLCRKIPGPTQMHINKLRTFTEEESHTNLEVKTPIEAAFQSCRGFKMTGKGDERNGRMTARQEKKNGGLNKWNDAENVPLLPAFQSIQNEPTFPLYESKDLPNDYGVLLPTNSTDKSDAGGFESKEEEEGIFVNWNPQTKKLQLPMFKTGERMKEWSDGGLSSEADEAYMMKRELRLESVYVRQGSEEKAEAERELERRGEIGMIMGDSLSKWNVVVCMDD